MNSEQTVRVRAPQAVAVHDLIVAEGATVDVAADATMTVRLLDAERIGELAGLAGLVLHGLSPQRASLEAVLIDRTHEVRDYGGGTTIDLDQAQPGVLVPDRNTL